MFGGTGREACLYGPAISSAVFRTPYYLYCMSGQACYGPRNMTAASVFGNIGYPEIDYAAWSPLRYDDPAFTLPELVVVWGKEPLASNPDGLFGHAIVDMMKRGTKPVSYTHLQAAWVPPGLREPARREPRERQATARLPQALPGRTGISWEECRRPETPSCRNAGTDAVPPCRHQLV